MIRLKTKSPREADFAEPINSGKAITHMRQITEDESGNVDASFYTGVAVKPNGSANSESQINSDGQGLSHMKMRVENIGSQLTINRKNGFEVLLTF